MLKILQTQNNQERIEIINKSQIKFIEMKNTMCETRNKLDWINSRLATA